MMNGEKFYWRNEKRVVEKVRCDGGEVREDELAVVERVREAGKVRREIAMIRK